MHRRNGPHKGEKLCHSVHCCGLCMRLSSYRCGRFGILDISLQIRFRLYHMRHYPNMLHQSLFSIISPPFQTNFTTIWEAGQLKQKQRRIGELVSHKMLIKITERR